MQAASDASRLAPTWHLQTEPALHKGNKVRQDSFSNPLQMKPENVITLSPKYLKPLTGKKLRALKSRRAECSGEGRAPGLPAAKVFP